MNIIKNKNINKFIFLITSIIVTCFNTFDVYKLYGGYSIPYISKNFTSTLITPDGFTFSIWGVIFLMLIAVGVKNVKNPALISKKALSYFIGSSLAICSWIVSFQLRVLYAPTLLLLIIFLCNYKVNTLLIGKIKHFYLIYTSWTMIASVIGLVILLQYDLGMSDLFTIKNQINAIIALGFATIFLIFLAFKFDSLIPLLVGIWAYLGIYRVENSFQSNTNIKYATLVYSVFLLIFLFIIYQNKKSCLRKTPI